MCILFKKLARKILNKQKTEIVNEEEAKEVIATLSPEIVKPKKIKWKLIGKIIDKTAIKCLRCGVPLQRAGGQIVFYCAACRRLQRGGKRNRRLLKRLERKAANG